MNSAAAGTAQRRWDAAHRREMAVVFRILSRPPVAVHLVGIGGVGMGGLARLYADTDLAICRAGASTCAELLAFGLPALLVPYPYAAADHQRANALALSKIGAADYVAERDLTSTWLADYLDACIRAPERLARMRAASRAQPTRQGAEKLAELVAHVGWKKPGPLGESVAERSPA